MPTPMNLRHRLRRQAPGDVESPDALRPINLVPRKRHEVHRQDRKVEVHFAQRLGPIHMEGHASLPTQCAKRGQIVLPPSSLCTAMRETRIVSRRRARAKVSGATMPLASGSSQVI